jgi:hypothetical protein
MSNSSEEDYSSVEYYLNEITGVIKQTESSLLSLQTQLSLELFSLQNQSIIPASKATYDLLTYLSVQKEELTTGVFLKAFTSYVVSNKLVDSVDYEIHLTKELREGFQFEPGTIKVPFVACIGRLPIIFL